MKRRISAALIFWLCLFSLFPCSSFADSQFSDGETDISGSFSYCFGLAASGKAGTVKLLSDETISENLTVPEGVSVTVDLNGHILDRGLCDEDTEEDGNLFTLEENASLTILDSAPSAVHSGTELTGGILRGGAGDDVGGCIQLEDGSAFTMEGGAISDCTTDDHGGAIRVDGDNVTVTLTGVTIENCSTDDSSDNCCGGAVYLCENAVLTAVNCRFFYNASEDEGGAFYLDDECIARFESCNFTGNSAEDEGGAVYKDSDGETLFRDCIFTGNFTEESGSAIYINDEGCYLVDTSVTGNTAEECGAVYVDAYHSLDVSGLTVVRYNKGDDETSNVYIGSHGYLFGAACYIGTVYDGGLYEGSRIGLSYDGNAGEEAVILNISEYQKQFFFADSADHPLSWEADESRTVTELLISSAIGEGNGGLIILLALILIAGGVTGYFIKNRGKGGKKK